MHKSRYEDACRTTLVCVDDYGNATPAGRLYHPSLQEGEAFRSLIELLQRMEELTDSMERFRPLTRDFPPPPAPSAAGPPDTGPQEGRLATFAVRIIFRQNASWQGSVTWLEEGREQTFRSVLELVLLMDNALQSAPATPPKRVPASPSCTA